MTLQSHSEPLNRPALTAGWICACDWPAPRVSIWGLARPENDLQSFIQNRNNSSPPTLYNTFVATGRPQLNWGSSGLGLLILLLCTVEVYAEG